MYCQNCGKSVIDGSTYCSYCGATIINTAGDRDERKPHLVLKPQFLSFHMLSSILGWQLLMTLWSALIFGIFAFLIRYNLDMDFSVWVVSLIAGIIFFFGTPIVILIFKYIQYANTRFAFFDSKFEYCTGYFRSEIKTFNYNDIIEMNLERRSFQRVSNVGDIIISTAAVGLASGIARSGIRLFDVENPDAAFNQIRYIIKKTTGRY